MKIGLFFGSFNPITVAHMILAQYMLDNTDIDELWFVVSPQNPFKDTNILADEKMRLEMVKIAIKGKINMKACDVEFFMPKPSYTIDTLKSLNKSYPNDEFSIIIGTDILNSMNKWKNYEQIIANHKIYVVSRETGSFSFPILSDDVNNNIIFKNDFPKTGISSTLIRDTIKSNKNPRCFLNEDVWDYIQKNELYKNRADAEEKEYC